MTPQESNFTGKSLRQRKTDRKVTIEEIELDCLGIDYRYQRPLDEKRGAKIAKAFDAGAAKALSVAIRADGTYWIYDGQHTAEAMRQVGLSSAFCVVSPSTGWRQEARWFLLMNGSGVRKADARARHHAETAAQDDIAIDANNLLASLGITIAKGGSAPKTTSAINSIKGWIRRDRVRLIEAIQMVHRLWKDESHAYTQIILRGAWEVAGTGLLEDVEKGLKKHKITPRRLLDVAAGMQSATGMTGGGAGFIKKAYFSLAKVEQ